MSWIIITTTSRLKYAIYVNTNCLAIVYIIYDTWQVLPFIYWFRCHNMAWLSSTTPPPQVLPTVVSCSYWVLFLLSYSLHYIQINIYVACWCRWYTSLMINVMNCNHIGRMLLLMLLLFYCMQVFSILQFDCCVLVSLILSVVSI
jgi:hypothetical protein